MVDAGTFKSDVDGSWGDQETAHSRGKRFRRKRIVNEFHFGRFNFSCHERFSTFLYLAIGRRRRARVRAELCNRLASQTRPLPMGTRVPSATDPEATAAVSLRGRSAPSIAKAMPTNTSAAYTR